MKYYYPEHVQGYARIKEEGKSAWAEIHGGQGFDNFASRAFLEAALPHLAFPTPSPAALEYGCGTGPGACFLAERGFLVDAIDLIPTAIQMAQEIASRRGLSIRFAVADVCELPQEPNRHGRFDLIVDSFCLQCIVFDGERQRVFSAVRSRLKPGGYYLVSTAVLDREHEALVGTETLRDSDTGVVYTRYESELIDLDTGIVLRPLEGGRADNPDAVWVAGRWYLPHRRHLRPAALEAELAAAGFRVAFRDGQHGGSVACVVNERLTQPGAPGADAQTRC